MTSDGRHVFSYEFNEQLHTWLHVHCPCSLENDEFVKGLFAIAEEEILRAVAEERHRVYSSIASPSQQ